MLFATRAKSIKSLAPSTQNLNTSIVNSCEGISRENALNRSFSGSSKKVTEDQFSSIKACSNFNTQHNNLTQTPGRYNQSTHIPLTEQPKVSNLKMSMSNNNNDAIKGKINSQNLLYINIFKI